MKKLLFTLVGISVFIGSFAQEVSLDLFANGFSNPVNLQNAGDDRLFVVEQAGIIKILNTDGSVNSTPFLDISGQVSCCGERGLLGLAFHPDYATNGFFYVNYTFSSGGALNTQISRYSVDPANPDVALPGSELKLLDYFQPASNHNGGCIAFGPDGYLYIASGDGGGGGDPDDRAQDTEFLLGKLLRIDIDNPSGGNNYGIPADNPFASDPPNAPEIWAYGLRNPWKFSFDSETGDLWIADVGQADIEEINRVSSTEAGVNYGWDCFEGTQPYIADPSPVCSSVTNITFPIAEYSSATGSPNCSITGGNVYRGDDHNGETGLYYAADVCSGKIFTVDNSGNLIDHGSFGGSWVSFGVDIEDELYIVDIGGEIFKISGSATFGTDEFAPKNLSVFPNPAFDQVTISLENGLISGYSIMDLKGSVILNQTDISSSRESLNVSALSNGIYLLKVVSQSGNSFIKKLVVE